MKDSNDLLTKQMRSRGILIREGAMHERLPKVMKQPPQNASKRKASLELYRSIDKVSKTVKSKKTPTGHGIYSLDNNMVVINVSIN